jgi:RimJ/RimL family protein N-acetyltransferase
MASEWRHGLPLLTGGSVTLRELTLADAQTLHACLTTEDVARFISPPPTTVAGFEAFIVWANAERQAGRYACFAVLPEGMSTAIGLFLVHRLDADFSTAEWGFALGSAFWGTGIFRDGADLVLEFAFETLGVRRLEARAAVQNGRGNGALQKVGAVPELKMRRSFERNGEYFDQVLWTILDSDWRCSRAVPESHTRIH